MNLVNTNIQQEAASANASKEPPKYERLFIKDIYSRRRVATKECGRFRESGKLPRLEEYFRKESEELKRKQTAIELEIKHIHLQNHWQHNHTNFLVNLRKQRKPPPPYHLSSTQPSDPEQLDAIIPHITKILQLAHRTNHLRTIALPPSKTFPGINRQCSELIFDVSRELAEDFFGGGGGGMLERVLDRELKVAFGFAEEDMKKSVKWCTKDYDDVDRLLVKDMLREESVWKDCSRKGEDDVKEKLVDGLLRELLGEAVVLFNNSICSR